MVTLHPHTQILELSCTASISDTLGNLVLNSFHLNGHIYDFGHRLNSQNHLAQVNSTAGKCYSVAFI